MMVPVSSKVGEDEQDLVHLLREDGHGCCSSEEDCLSERILFPHSLLSTASMMKSCILTLSQQTGLLALSTGLSQMMNGWSFLSGGEHGGREGAVTVS